MPNTAWDAVPLTPQQQAYAEEHHNLIYSFLKRYRFNIDEWYGVAALGFCKAVVRFEPSRKKAFSSFAYTVMLNDVRQVMRKERNAPQTVSIEAPLGGDLRIEDTLGYEQDFTIPVTAKLLKQYIATVHPHQHRKIFLLSIEGWKQREIADEMGFSQSYVSRILSRVRRGFRAYYEKHS